MTKIMAFKKNKKWGIPILRKFQCASYIKFLNWWWLILIYFFILLFLEFTFIKFFMTNVVLSFQKFIISQFFSWISSMIFKLKQSSLKSIVTWMIQKLIMLVLNMTSHFKFIWNPKSYNYDSPNCSFHYAFTQFTCAIDIANMNMWNFKHAIKNINKNKWNQSMAFENIKTFLSWQKVLKFKSVPIKSILWECFHDN